MVARATIEALLIPSSTIYPTPCPNEISWSYDLKKLGSSPRSCRSSGRRRQRTPGPDGSVDSCAPCRSDEPSPRSRQRHQLEVQHSARSAQLANFRTSKID